MSALLGTRCLAHPVELVGEILRHTFADREPAQNLRDLRAAAPSELDAPCAGVAERPDVRFASARYDCTLVPSVRNPESRGPPTSALSELLAMLFPSCAGRSACAWSAARNQRRWPAWLGQAAHRSRDRSRVWTNIRGVAACKVSHRIRTARWPLPTARATYRPYVERAPGAFLEHKTGRSGLALRNVPIPSLGCTWTLASRCTWCVTSHRCQCRSSRVAM